MKLRQGFTLLELLVAASVTAGLAVILAGTLSSILTTYAERNQINANDASMQVAASRINTLISTADYIYVNTPSHNTDSFLIMRHLLSSDSAKYDILCKSDSEKDLLLLSATVNSLSHFGSSTDPYSSKWPLLSVCNTPHVSTILKPPHGGPSGPITLSPTVISETLFNNTVQEIGHFMAWPIWSDSSGQDYSTNPPAIRYQILSKAVPTSVRASSTIGQYPSVYQTTVLTSGATGYKKVGP